jgi:two-component system, OmpR family, response regulator ChvI
MASSSPRILIVDDEADITSVMKRGLENAGFEVDVENNPLTALQNFKAGKYSLALLDIRMPQMEGFDLYERLSQLDSKMKVCFLTAFDANYFEKFKIRFPHLPTRCFIKKPVTIKDLVNIVEAELGNVNKA